MAELPLYQAIPRFKTNEDRIDTFVNGDENATYTTSGGVQVPSVRKFLGDLAADGVFRAPSMSNFLSRGDVTLVGSRWRIDTGEVLDVVAAGTGDYNHPISGLGLRVVPTKWGVSPKAFGAIGDGIADDNQAVQRWLSWMTAQGGNTSTAGLIDGHFRITQMVDFTQVKLRILGLSQRFCGFTQRTDNVGIVKIGGVGINDHGKYYNGFFARYANVQPVENTNAICILVEYFTYSEASNLEWYGGYRGIAALNTPSDNIFFSSTLRDIKGNRCSYRPYQISSGSAVGNTGNVISNLYYSGFRADVASATCDAVFVFERIGEGAISQINAEWCTANRILVAARCAPAITSMHVEGVAARNTGVGLIQAIGAQVTFSGLTIKTVNFSGGDPETAAVGPLASSALFEVSSETKGGAGRIVVTSGRNQGCTPATANTRVARTTDGWSVAGQAVEVMQWEDTDGVFTDASGVPKAELLTPPSSPHLPILRRWNDWTPAIYARGKDAGSTPGAILWAEIEDTNACYDPATGFFVAPKSGVVTVEFCVASSASGLCEVKLFTSGGAERTAYRRRFASGSAVGGVYYTSGGSRFNVARGEKIRVDTTVATTASDFSQVDFSMLA